MKKNYIKTIVFALLIIITSCKKDNVIENPITGKKVLVAKQDFPDKMKWDEAKIACSSLGDGWRLPTEYELEVMNSITAHLDNFKNEEEHWSSNAYGVDQKWVEVGTYLGRSRKEKTEYAAVRAVKDLE
jgi:hypothetical protein